MVGLRRQTTGGEDPETGVRCLTIEGIDDELRRADHVVLLLPGGAETHRFFRREYLSAMKRTAFLYNLGRGTVLAEEDLVWAIENRVLAGAGLDVFEQEPLPASSRLWGFRNVLILPHSSPAYAEYGTLFVEELVERFQGLGL
jgi:phosphoglycerate dehydrogenase-like enzyme